MPKGYWIVRVDVTDPEYRIAVKLRQPVSAMDLVIVEGYDGPQPGE